MLDVVALVQRNIQWYQIPWYREILKAIMLEFETLDAAHYPESLVLLSRALVSNPDVISPLIYVVTKTTKAHDLAGVSISLALIRSWFVAMTSWNTRMARGRFPLGSLNRSSLPVDFQYDYLSSVVVCLFDDTLPFQITQKALEFVYSIWDIIPNARTESLLKTLLESGIFIQLMLHWERHVRIFFAYTVAVRFLQPRKWCGNGGGMPSVHFEDFVEEAEADDHTNGASSQVNSSDEDDEEDFISIERMNSSSARLSIDEDQQRSNSALSFDGSPELKAMPPTRITPQDHLDTDFFGAVDVTGVDVHATSTYHTFLNPSRGSMINLHAPEQKSRDKPSSPQTPTAAGSQHPMGARRLVLNGENVTSTTPATRPNTTAAPTPAMSFNSSNDLIDSSGQTPKSNRNGTNNTGQHERKEEWKKEQNGTSQRNRNSSGAMSSTNNLLTPSQEKIGALLRCIRRQMIEYAVTRRKTYKQMNCIDAREIPNNMDDKLKDSSLLILWKDMQNEKLKDEHEYGLNEIEWGNDETFAANTFNGNDTKQIHPGIGGESLHQLKLSKEKDQCLLRKDFMWSNIALPLLEKIVYAKDALRLYTLASRRVHALQEQMKVESIKVPELTFVALVADESGHGYKDATTTRKDEYVRIQEA